MKLTSALPACCTLLGLLAAACGNFNTTDQNRTPVATAMVPVSLSVPALLSSYGSNLITPLPCAVAGNGPCPTPPPPPPPVATVVVNLWKDFFVHLADGDLCPMPCVVVTYHGTTQPLPPGTGTPLDINVLQYLGNSMQDRAISVFVVLHNAYDQSKNSGGDIMFDPPANAVQAAVEPSPAVVNDQTFYALQPIRDDTADCLFWEYCQTVQFNFILHSAKKPAMGGVNIGVAVYDPQKKLWLPLIIDPKIPNNG